MTVSNIVKISASAVAVLGVLVSFTWFLSGLSAAQTTMAIRAVETEHRVKVLEDILIEHRADRVRIQRTERDVARIAAQLETLIAELAKMQAGLARIERKD